MYFEPTKDYLIGKPVAVQETSSGLVLVKGGGVQQQAPPTPTMVFMEIAKSGPDAKFQPGQVVAFHAGNVQLLNDGLIDHVAVPERSIIAEVKEFSTVVKVDG